MLAKNFPQEAAQSFLSPNNQATIFPISVRGNIDDVNQFLLDTLPNIRPPNSTELNMELMGTSAFMITIQASVEHDMALGDGIVIPIAFAILALMLRSARLLILPLFCLVVSGLTAFGLMYFATLFMNVMASTMSLMMRYGFFYFFEDVFDFI